MSTLTRVQRLEKQRPAAVTNPYPELWDHVGGLYKPSVGGGPALTEAAFQAYQDRRRAQYPGASGPFAVIVEMGGQPVR